MQKRICAAAAALLLILGGCAEKAPPTPNKTVVTTTGRPSSSSASEEEAIELDKHQLQMVEDFNTPDYVLTAECPETLDNTSRVVRTDATLGARVASILTQSAFEPNLPKPLTDPELEARKIVLEARNGPKYSRVSLFGYDEEHPFYPDKALLVLENSTGATRRYLYELPVFEELDRELQTRIRGVAVAFSGNLARLISKYDLAAIKRDKGLWGGEFLQFGSSLLWRFVPGDPAQSRSVVELFAAGNGRTLYSYGISEPVHRMEKYSGPEGGDYRLVTPSRIIYKKSGDPAWQKEWELPSAATLFTANAQLTGSYDRRFGKLAYAGEDGIHLADEYGQDDRLLVAHQALDTVMSGLQGGSWYFNDPRLMLDGKKLVSSIVGTQRGRERLGFAVSDLESFETTYFTDFGAQDELSVRYIGDRVVSAQQPGRLTLLDTKTMEPAIIPLEGEEGTLFFSEDYNEFVVYQPAPVIENEPVTATLYRCTADLLDDRTDRLLVAQGDIFYPVAITENYLIGYCEDTRGIHYTATRYTSKKKLPPAQPAASSSAPQADENESSAEARFPGDSLPDRPPTASELYEQEFGELPPDITPDWMRDMLLQSIRNTRGASPESLAPYLRPYGEETASNPYFPPYEEDTRLKPYDSLFP